MEIDPRGPRVSALITTVVLAVVLVTGSVWLLAAQALVFAAGAAFGLRYSPDGFLYRTLIRPRLGPPRELEPEAPPRFAQAVGLVFAIAGVAGYATGLTWLGLAATAAALVAAFLCELPHVALVTAGTLRVVLRDGSQEDFSAGEVMLLPPGHDAWTVGDRACTFVEFSKGNDYYS